MITFEVNDRNESIEIYLDAEGIDELIGYLKFLKSEKDHMHLIAGNELGEKKNQSANKLIKHARLVFID